MNIFGNRGLSPIVPAKVSRRQAFKLWWPVWRVCIVYVVFGYAVYFMARVAPESPTWAMQMIESLKPWMGALKTAERISDQAFPVQILTIYVFFASMPLMAYAAYCCLFNVQIHNAFVRHHRALNTSRFKLIIAGFCVIAFAAIYYNVLLHDDAKPDWRDVMHYSPGFWTATFSLISTVLPLMGAAGPMLIKLSLVGLHLKAEHQSQN